MGGIFEGGSGVRVLKGGGFFLSEVKLPDFGLLVKQRILGLP